MPDRDAGWNGQGPGQGHHQRGKDQHFRAGQSRPRLPPIGRGKGGTVELVNTLCLWHKNTSFCFSAAPEGNAAQRKQFYPDMRQRDADHPLPRAACAVPLFVRRTTPRPADTKGRNPASTCDPTLP